MKRFASGILLLFYLAFSVGVDLTLHYCGGNLADAALFTEASCCCDEGASTGNTSDENDDCCKNEFKTLKITTEQIKSEHQLKYYETDVFLQQPVSLFQVDFSYSFSKNNNTPSYLARPPDLLPNCPIYILYNRLIFYDNA